MQGYRIAESFMQYNLFFTGLFIIISLAIAVLALRVYVLSKHRKPGLFSLAFLLIGLGHVAAFIHFLITVTDSFVAMPGSPPGPPTQSFLIFLLFPILYLAGVILLFVSTNKKMPGQAIAVIGLLTFIGSLMMPRPNVSVHFFSIIFFAFIAWHSFKNFRKHRAAGPLLVLLGFAALLIGNIILIFSHREMLFFTIGRCIQLVGYLAFLVDMVLVLKK